MCEEADLTGEFNFEVWKKLELWGFGLPFPKSTAVLGQMS